MRSSFISFIVINFWGCDHESRKPQFFNRREPLVTFDKVFVDITALQDVHQSKCHASCALPEVEWRLLLVRSTRPLETSIPRLWRTWFGVSYATIFRGVETMERDL